MVATQASQALAGTRHCVPAWPVQNPASTPRAGTDRGAIRPERGWACLEAVHPLLAVAIRLVAQQRDEAWVPAALLVPLQAPGRSCSGAGQACSVLQAPTCQ